MPYLWLPDYYCPRFAFNRSQCSRKDVKMPEKKKDKKIYKIELTKLSMFLWACGFLFLIIWAFILGILVGEGFLPEKRIRPKEEKNNLYDHSEKKERLSFSFHERLTANKSIKNNKQNNICYSVQIAAFLKEKDAKNMVKKFKLKGYKVYYIKAIIKDKTYYRVRCGKSSNRKEMELLKDRLLKNEHIKGIIVRCR